MFEEEAEKYRKENLCKKCHKHCKEGMCTCSECKIKTFKDGAEFGHNKANEWHYVKDGEYPKECDCCLLYVGSRFNCITGWRHCGVWYFDDNRNLKMWQDEVIAWKEITPPKEIKEND